MRNLKLIIAYKGTNYHGFQVQKNAIAVCQAFQDVVQKVMGERYDVVGCSRTDSGVHASGYVLTIKCDNPIPCRGLKMAMNMKLPADIAVLDCCEMPEGFHPRYDTTGKKYVYRIWNRLEKSPFLYETTHHHPMRLYLDRMEEGAKHMVGTHDFSSFCSMGGSVEDKVRTVYACTVKKTENLVEITVIGDGFLYNMVRIMVGTLLEISYGKYEPQDVVAMIQAKDRNRAGVTAPPHGLTLEEVYYEDMDIVMAGEIT